MLAEWQNNQSPVVERLPLNYDDTTLRTIERIDVLWLRGRSIKRAFEVEHTTSIDSAILRRADLLALQPNMDIRFDLVAPAPAARRSKKRFNAPYVLSWSVAPFRRAVLLFPMTAFGSWPSCRI